MDEDTTNDAPAGGNPTSTGNTPRDSQSGASNAQSQGKLTPTTSAHSSATPSTTGPTNTQQSKRRRGLGVVTPNACTECRKKRAKCDGQNPCGRCKTQKDVECVYEVPVRHSKENLRLEIEQLRNKQNSNDQVMAALVRPELWEEVLSRLRLGQSVESISEWLGTAQASGGGNVSKAARKGESTFGGAAASNAASNAAPMANFAGSGPGSLAAMNLGATENLSPIVSQQQQPGGFRDDMGHGDPWHFGSQPGAGPSRGGSLPGPMNWTADTNNNRPQTQGGSWGDSLSQVYLSDGVAHLRGVEQILSPLHEPEMNSPSGSWSSITDDIKLVHHLLALYFCWEYPTFASLSKEHFLRDFQDGRHRFCSPILVNALLALGCRFSTQPKTRENPSDPYSSGDHFFKESQRLFAQENDHHSLTTIQALGIMSIRESSCGRDSESWYYAGQSVRLAIEMGLHRVHDGGDEDELAVQAATFWGAFALDHAWSLATGTLPQCSCFPHLPPKPAIIDDIEASLWVPYTDDGAALQRSCEQPSNVRSVYKCFCELSELVHQSLYVLHSPSKPLTSRDLLNLYTQYLNWYDSIPEVLRLGHNFTPAVLFAHMYYHFAILLLFRPLIKLRILGSNVVPRDVCSQAADAIQGLLRSYSQLYTLRRTPSFVPYFVLTSTIMHLAIGAATPHPSSSRDNEGASSHQSAEVSLQMDAKVTESLNQGIRDLAEMAPCHHFAEQALNILRFLAKKWKIDIDVDQGRNGGGGEKGGRSDQGVTAEDYDNMVRPTTNSLNFFAPNVRAQDFLSSWGASPSPSEGGRESIDLKDTANNMENPLFWPFPMQGRPILPAGDALGQAGFAML